MEENMKLFNERQELFDIVNRIKIPADVIESIIPGSIMVTTNDVIDYGRRKYNITFDVEKED